MGCGTHLGLWGEVGDAGRCVLGWGRGQCWGQSHPAPTALEVSLPPGSPQGCSSLPSDPKSPHSSEPSPAPDISSPSRGAASFSSFHSAYLRIILIFSPWMCWMLLQTPGRADFGSFSHGKRHKFPFLPWGNTRKKKPKPGSSHGRAQGELPHTTPWINVGLILIPAFFPSKPTPAEPLQGLLIGKKWVKS